MHNSTCGDLTGASSTLPSLVRGQHQPVWHSTPGRGSMGGMGLHLCKGTDQGIPMARDAGTKAEIRLGAAPKQQGTGTAALTAPVRNSRPVKGRGLATAGG